MRGGLKGRARLADIDWLGIFGSTTPLLEIIIRGTVVYLALFILMRIVLKRESGGVGVSDILVIVLLADSSQNALADDYRTVPDGIALVAVILFWAWAIDWLGFHVPRLRPWIHAGPLRLVKDGVPLHRNLRRELITQEDLMEQLRLQGYDGIGGIRAVYLEEDGRFSVLNGRGSSNGGNSPSSSAVQVHERQ